MANINNLDLTDPDAVRSVSFESARKGYDKAEVSAFLARVASHVESQQRAMSAMEARLDSLEIELARAQIEAVRELDRDDLTELLGAEAAKVLQAAHAAESERLARAEADAAALLARVEHDVLAKLEEAEEDAARLVERAHVESERLREQTALAAEDELRQVEEQTIESQELTKQARQRAAADAADEIEAAKDAGRELVLEAQVVRERMLKDLSRRRQAGRRELEQIRAGRDRLLSAFEAAARTLDEILEELTVSLPEARIAAEAAGRRAAEEEVSVEQLENELAAARSAGLPLVDTANAELHAAPVEEPPADDRAADDEDDEPVAAPRDVDADDRTVVLSEMGSGRRGLFKRPREVMGLPADEVPVLRAPDDVEEVRVVAAAANRSTEQPIEPPAEEPAVELAEPTEEPIDRAPEESTEEPTATGEEEDPVGALFAKMRARRESDTEPSDPKPSDTEPSDTEPSDPEPSAPEPSAPEPAEKAPDAVPATEPEPTGQAPTGDAANVTADPASRPAAETDLEIVERRNEAIAGHVGSIAAALKRALADDQNELFDVLRRANGAGSEADLPSHDAHCLQYVRAAGPALSAAFIEGAQFVDGLAGQVELAASAEIIATGVVDQLRAAFVAVVEDEAAANDPITAIRAAAREIRDVRIGPVAFDAALAAFDHGSYGALAAGAPLRWVNDPDHECGSQCRENAAGGSTGGTAFKSGAMHPPAVPGCRCVLIEV